VFISANIFNLTIIFALEGNKTAIYMDPNAGIHSVLSSSFWGQSSCPQQFEKEP